VSIRRPVLFALTLAAALGGVAACSRGGSSKIEAASSTSTSSTLAGTGETTTSIGPGSSTTHGATSSTKAGTPTSSTIAYFTVPPSTTAAPPDGGGYEPGESVGRKFVDAVMDGKKAAATPLATAAVIKQFEPWKPYARSNDQGVTVPDYHYSGSTKKGDFTAVLAPTVTVRCGVDTGKVVACSFGE
jgi:hypothetical protein